MRAARTLVDREGQEANVNDLKLLAISAEKLTLFLSSLPRAGQYYAAIASVRVVQRSSEPELLSFCDSKLPQFLSDLKFSFPADALA